MFSTATVTPYSDAAASMRRMEPLDISAALSMTPSTARDVMPGWMVTWHIPRSEAAFMVSTSSAMDASLNLGLKDAGLMSQMGAWIWYEMS